MKPLLYESLEDAIKFFMALKPCIVLLRGDLASGKTTMVQTIAKEMGSEDCVTSPTFGIQNVYSTKEDLIFHYDLYRKDLSECLELGLLEMLEDKGWHWIEWGDEVLENLLKQSGFSLLIVTIAKRGENRQYRISS